MTDVVPLLRRVGAGLALAFATPPWGVWPLAPIGIALLVVELRDRPYRSRLGVVAVVMAVHYSLTLSWVWSLHPAALLLIPIVAALDGVVLATGPGRGPLRDVGFVAALTLTTAFRWSWPWGGVPLSNLALGQVGGPLLQIASIATALGVVTILGVLGVALAAAAERRWRTAGVATAIVLATLGIAAVDPGSEFVDEIDVAIVQGGGPLGTRARDTDEARPIERHLEATRTIDRPVDLILWPENVASVDGPLDGSPLGLELSALSGELDAVLVTGAIEREGDRFRNSALVFTAEGEQSRYEKVNRVPFGEFIPFRGLIEAVVGDVRSLVPRDAVVGENPAAIDTPVGRFTSVISFELFFPRRARTGNADGGLAILGPTNASSYPDTRVPEQTLASSRLRAVEGGRWVLQAAPTGYSAVVDADGDVIARTGLREQRVLYATIELRDGDTWTTTWGRVPLLWLALIGWLAAWWMAPDLPDRLERLRSRVRSRAGA
ncbi:MAG: apolipoprotein N-acyltransferase [Actinomycetota bacterium]